MPFVTPNHLFLLLLFLFLILLVLIFSLGDVLP